MNSNYKQRINNMIYNDFIIKPFQEKTTRHNFIQRVYTILLCMLISTVISMACFRNITSFTDFMFSETGQALYIISFVGLLVSTLGMLCAYNAIKNPPANYIFLICFTSFMNYLISYATIYYDTEMIFQAGVITVGITISLTLYACQTKYDFTTWGGMLISFLVGIIILGILNIWIKNSILQNIIAGCGAILFSFYIIYDTQLIVGHKHKNQFSEDDYVLAAISLYLDIINLFLYMLQILKFCNNK